MHKCVNNSTANVYHLEQFVGDFFPYSQKQLGFDKPVTIKFESDPENADTMLGKTAFYDPEAQEIALYVDGRHPKDVMRSLSHELVHHAQNCRGDFKTKTGTEPGYAQRDPHLRKMEREAFTKGNLIFRDFEDLIKTGKIKVFIDFTKSGEPQMSLQEWKNNEINTKLMKKWGLLKEFKEVTTEDTEDLEEASLTEDSEDEESENYGKDESADKRKEDGLEHHLDAIEDHLKALRGDMHFDEDHIDEGHEHSADCGCPEAISEGDDGDEEEAPEPGVKVTKKKHLSATTTKLPPVKVKESTSRKISVREAKELTRRIIERIKSENK